jgi:uncharacterized membrane protein
MPDRIIPPEHQERIVAATKILAGAEAELHEVLHVLETVDRADKKMISDALRTAFDKVTAARANLETVLKAFAAS